MSSLPKHYTSKLDLRLTPYLRDRIEAARRPGEKRSETARRLILLGLNAKKGDLNV